MSVRRGKREEEKGGGKGEGGKDLFRKGVEGRRKRKRVEKLFVKGGGVAGVFVWVFFLFCGRAFLLFCWFLGTCNMSEKLTRIAIVSGDRCKPKKCRQECKRSCPVVRVGKGSRKNWNKC